MEEDLGGVPRALEFTGGLSSSQFPLGPWAHGGDSSQCACGREERAQNLGQEERALTVVAPEWLLVDLALCLFGVSFPV